MTLRASIPHLAKRAAYLLVASFLLAGCAANQYAVHWDYSVQGADSAHPKSIVIDAKQRAIIALNKKDPGSNNDHDVVCAEPSPDALSAIAAAFSTSAAFTSGQSSKELAAALVQKEQASQIGIRDATIQILRDGLYRQCEAYMDGIITGDQYEAIANRYVDGAVSLLAVEGLTSGTPSPGPVLAPGGGLEAKTGTITLASGSPETLPSGLKVSVPDKTVLTLNGKDATLNGDSTAVLSEDASATLTKDTPAPLPTGTELKLAADANAKLAQGAKYTQDGTPASTTQETDVTLKQDKPIKLTAILPIAGVAPLASAQAGGAGGGGKSQASSPSKTSAGVSASVATAVTNIVQQFLQKSAFDVYAKSCLTFLNQSLADIQSKKGAIEKQLAIEKKQAIQKEPAIQEQLESAQLGKLSAATQTSIDDRNTALTNYIKCLDEYPKAAQFGQDKSAPK